MARSFLALVLNAAPFYVDPNQRGEYKLRLIHICAALTGAYAFIALAGARHAPGANADFSALIMAALAQISAASAGLAIAQRSGSLNVIGAALILAGANIFASVIYSHRAIHSTRWRRSAARC